jgi:molybdopterin/thiamine biosynthesis adenylyltransferase/rhodanese-related sulfurtransferase
MNDSMPFSSSELIRYSRHFSLQSFGIDNQAKLKKARVLCVGAGGLGAPALLYLAAAGIGHLGIIDSDIVELSNLQRQVIFSVGDIGKNKALSAQEKLSQLNPDISITTYPARLTIDNAFEILKNYDLILDGTDNYATRYLINDVSYFLKKPLIFASIFQFEGQCSVFNSTDHSPCYRCLYSEPPPAGLIPDCAEGGVLGILPGILGTLQATEAIKLITGMGHSLTGRLLLYHALNMEFRELAIQAKPDCILCGLKKPFEQLPRYQQQCHILQTDLSKSEISALELNQLLKQEKKILLLDVRESYEYEICHLENSILIPLNQLPIMIHTLDKENSIIIYCKAGIRSHKAMDFLKESGFKNIRHLTGGILAFAKEIDHSLRIY